MGVCTLMTFLWFFANLLLSIFFENVSDSWWHVDTWWQSWLRHLVFIRKRDETSSNVRLTNDAVAPHLFLWCPTGCKQPAVSTAIIFTLLSSSPPLLSSCLILLHSYQMTSPLNDISLRKKAQHSHWTLCRTLVGMWTWVFGLPLIFPNLVWFDFSYSRSRKFAFFSIFH